MSAEREVHNQTELDAALTDPKVGYVHIVAGDWLTVGDTGTKYVTVGGSATIQDVGDSATIQDVRGSATIQDVRGSATIKYVGDSATIQYVGDSATIQDVRGSATIQDVGDSATIKYVRDSATIKYVGGSATIKYVGDSATIQYVRGTVVIQALYDTSKVEHTTIYVCVYRRSSTATVEGAAHVIDLSGLDESDPQTWCDLHGVEVFGKTKAAKRAIVFKAVTDTLQSGRGLAYPLGAKVEAADWQPTNACGAGLHFGPSPRDARDYHRSATRFLACEIRLSDAVGITERGATPKIKARSCRVLHEVDLDGERIEPADDEAAA